MKKLTSFRAAFPVAERYTYLNHAAISPLSRPCVDATQAYLDELVHHGAAHYPKVVSEPTARVRAQGAELVGGDPEGVFIVRSTTQGLGVAATGLPAGPGDNLVLIRGEFPANQRPWLPLARKGVELRWIEQHEGRVSLDDLKAAIDDRTVAVTVSFVQFLSGFRLDLAAVGALCQAHDALFIVDAIQGLGAMPIDVKAMGIDLLSADAHKWLLGAEGVGIGYASPKAIERIVPALEGWMSAQNPFDFFDIDQPLKATAARYEEGAPNAAGVFGFDASLRLLLETGLDDIHRRVLALSDRLAEGLVEAGWTLRSPRATPGEKSGIVLVTKPELDAERVVSQLREAKIIASVRGGAVRLAPHAYLLEDEIDRAVAVLSQG